MKMKKLEPTFEKKLTIPYGQHDVQYDYQKDVLWLRLRDGHNVMLGSLSVFKGRVEGILSDIEKHR